MTTPDWSRLDGIVLTHGGHKPGCGYDVMEALALAYGLDHTDFPEDAGVIPADVAGLLRHANDVADLWRDDSHRTEVLVTVLKRLPVTTTNTQRRTLALEYTRAHVVAVAKAERAFDVAVATKEVDVSSRVSVNAYELILARYPNDLSSKLTTATNWWHRTLLEAQPHADDYKILKSLAELSVYCHHLVSGMEIPTARLGVYTQLLNVLTHRELDAATS